MTTTTASDLGEGIGEPSGQHDVANWPNGSATVLDTSQVAATTALPKAPSASHHRGAQTSVDESPHDLGDADRPEERQALPR